MEKVELINPKKYFVESRKAVQIALDKERELYAALSPEEKLTILKERKKETQSVEEYEAIEKLEKELEKENKFNFPIPLVPDEFKDMVRQNAMIEAAEHRKKLKELKEELKKQLPYLEDVLLPLLINIDEMNRFSVVPFNVDKILNADFQRGTGIRVEPDIVRTTKKPNEKIDEVKELIQFIKKMKI